MENLENNQPVEHKNEPLFSFGSSKFTKTRNRAVPSEKIDGMDQVSEKIKAEIIASISKNNPNIGRCQSVNLKSGPRAYKIAVIYQILDAKTKLHHHIVLTLQTWHYNKAKETIEEKSQYNITLDNQSNDEIGILRDSIDAFINEVTIKPDVYAVVKKDDFEQLNKSNKNISLNETIESILESEENCKVLLQQGGLNLFKNLAEWVITTDNPQAIVDKLKELEIDTIKDLNLLSCLTQLQQVLIIWQDNRNNNLEEFWQGTFSDYSWVISQVFSQPLVIFGDKAYIGGKNINNKGGNIVDFLFKNKVTENVILIEIKTPTTKLLSGRYRQTYSMSTEVSGALNQLLNYKKQIQFNYSSLIQEVNKNETFTAINPKTLLIIGDSEVELQEREQVNAFELFRSNSKDIEVITFDELFAKVSILIELITAGIQRENQNE